MYHDGRMLSHVEAAGQPPLQHAQVITGTRGFQNSPCNHNSAHSQDYFIEGIVGFPGSVLFRTAYNFNTYGVTTRRINNNNRLKSYIVWSSLKTEFLTKHVPCLGGWQPRFY